ncbi:SAM-dependent methyltransferase [Microbacterium testaceum]|uniref:class I SAM-dependent DNA methyltransferase n=1 Tax=Microbacterium TaxID=33882 RepID=UPI0027829AEF|nr:MULTISPECIES: class I SAM-dependent methyltransferase [Microbacterium]MDQ1111493.1 SAM-dependent methyltransferase [Microbacterium testaceum]MDR6097971.1 SAM-dependent methyltransferase [Microbacterium sp. SORGH_AS_0454]
MSAPPAYDARADEYIAALGSMDAVHPVDRSIVDAWAASVTGPLLDAGCGPGHWTGHLARQGLDVRGVDLSPRFVEHARAVHAGIRFDVDTIDGLEAADGEFGGILSWFSTIHHEAARIDVPLREFARTLRPGGRLLLGFFVGAEVEAFEHAVDRAYRWPAAELGRRADAAGFDVVETHTRETRGGRPVGALACERRA